MRIFSAPFKTQFFFLLFKANFLLSYHFWHLFYTIKITISYTEFLLLKNLLLKYNLFLKFVFVYSRKMFFFLIAEMAPWIISPGKRNKVQHRNNSKEKKMFSKLCKIKIHFLWVEIIKEKSFILLISLVFK